MSNHAEQVRMEARNSMILESSPEDSMLFETVKSLVKQDRKETENEEDFFLISQVQETQYSGTNIKEETLHKHQMEETFQWMDLCRICANANDHLIPIFEGEGAELDLSNKILKYLPIHVSKSDTLPLQLCYHCAVTILAWHELSKDCLNAEKKLLEMQDMLQNKQQNHNAIPLVNLDVSTPVTSTISTISNVVISQTDQQTDGKDNTQDTEDINKFNRCGPVREKSFAAYCSSRNAVRWANNLITKCENKPTDATAKLISATENAKEISERETGDSSDNSSEIEFDEKEDLNISKCQYLRSTKEGYTCDNCQRIFKTKYLLTHHMISCGNHGLTNQTESLTTRIRVAGKSEKIDDNPTKQEDSNHLKEYAKNAKNNESQCHAEPEKSLRKRSLRTYPCRHCEYTAEKKKLLSVHLAEMHSEFARKNRKSFVDTETVMRARMEHNGKVYYHCGECGKNLNSPYTFYWHIRIHTGERLFTCHMCGKRFRVNQGLARHLKETHAGIKNVPCDLCGRMFSTRRNAEDHRRIHTGERPYVCNVCGKTFKQKASLFVHNRTHSDVFPFKCSYCEQTFRTRPPLMVHITKHTGEKPYACDVCGRCFRIKYELKRHRLIHSDEKPWHCTDCDLSFRQKRYLINHKRLNHEPSRCLTAAK